MTRTPSIDLTDPLDSLRYEERRGCAQAADFLQLLGFPIAAGTLEKLDHAGKFRTDRDGKISDSSLLRIVKKQPSWLRELPYPELPDGMVTVRTALEMFPELKIEVLLKAITVRNYFLLRDGRRRYVTMHESWLRIAFKLGNPVESERSKPEKLASKPTTPRRLKTENVPQAAQLAKPVEKSKGPIHVGDVLVVPMPVPVKAPKEKSGLVSLMFSAQYLQTCGFPILYQDLYHRGVKRKEPLFPVVKKGHKLFMETGVLEGLADDPPEWLRNFAPRDGVPKGYMFTRDALIENGFRESRFYEATSSGLIETETLSEGHKQGKLYVISCEELDRIVADVLLCSFLRGGKVTIPEIEEARKKHPITEATHPRVPSDLPQAPVDTEVLVFCEPIPAGQTEEESEQPNRIGIDEVLRKVHIARRIISLYEESLRSGLTDEELVERFSRLDG